MLPPMPPLIAMPVPPPPPLAVEVSVAVPRPAVVDEAWLSVAAPPIVAVVVEPPPPPLPVFVSTPPPAWDLVVANPPPTVSAAALPLVVPFRDEVPVVVAVPLLPPWACDQLPLIPPPAMIESAAPAEPA